MVTFKFELEEPSIVNGFTRGHMTVHGNYGQCTSKNRIPDQSMMLFLSVTLLLDNICEFFATKHQSMLNFVGIDCSFQLTFVMKMKEQIDVLCGDTLIAKVQTTELIQAIWTETIVFTNRYSRFLEKDTIVSEDLHLAIEDFQKQFNCDVIP